MVVLSKAFSALQPKTILVVGDLILDRYIFGKTARISPEAPVPVLVAEHDEAKSGGAGNVALNILSMGSKPRLISRVGDDDAGSQLRSLLQAEGVDISGIVTEAGWQTPVKTRVIASSQQLLRIDREHVSILSESAEQSILNNLSSLFDGVALVAISDYAKGMLSDSLLRSIIQYARSHNIPCITDPKGTNFQKYAGSTILKPNTSETLKASAAEGEPVLEKAAQKIIAAIDVDYLVVTRSELGISLFHKNGTHEQFPVVSKEVRDSTGAGDTVLAMLSVAYASGIPLTDAISLANVAASCGVLRVGCARISLQDIAAMLIEQNPSGKICTGEFFKSLLTATQQNPLLMVKMPSSLTLSSQHLIKLSLLSSQNPSHRLIACFEETSLDPSLLELIASFQNTHLVVHGCDMPFLDRNLSKDHLVVQL